LAKATILCQNLIKTDLNLISIIIPVYNVEKYISRCLDSILNQTFQDFEIILVNDISPDNSSEIAENYSKKDTRIRIIDNQENSGAAWSRMVGYSNARGNYITFCDPDDFLPIDALELLHNAIVKDNDADICIGNFQRVYPNGSKSKIVENHLNYGNDKWNVAKSTLKYETPHYLWNKIFKAELFKNNEIITHKNFSKSSDEYLFFQVLQNCKKIINVDKVVYYYYDNQESASYNKNNANALKAMMISQKYVENIYSDKEGFKELIHQIKVKKYANFITLAGSDKKLLKMIFDSNVDYLFTPWNLIKSFHKRKAMRVFSTYLKARIKSFI
jgi:glycosyltransferase involved in cell wall biosynthesis